MSDRDHPIWMTGTGRQLTSRREVRRYERLSEPDLARQAAHDRKHGVDRICGRCPLELARQRDLAKPPIRLTDRGLMAALIGFTVAALALGWTLSDAAGWWAR